MPCRLQGRQIVSDMLSRGWGKTRQRAASSSRLQNVHSARSTHGELTHQNKDSTRRVPGRETKNGDTTTPIDEYEGDVRRN